MAIDQLLGDDLAQDLIGAFADAHQHRVAFSALPESVRSVILAFVFEAWRAALLKST